jgi:putative peptidoglycan lipid II flippase
MTTSPPGPPAARPGPLAAVGGLAGAAVLLATITVFARLMGFVRVLVFAHTVGPSCLGDAYYTANTIPNILFDVVAGGALSSIVVPVLAGPVDDGDRQRADRIASALMTWTLLLLVPVALLGILLANPLVGLLVGGGHEGCAAGSQVDVGGRMLAVFMPQVFFYGAGVVLIGVLQAHRRFLAPALGPLVSSVVVSAAYLVFAGVADRRETNLSTLTRGHELVLSVGTTVGVAALTIPLLIALRRTGRRLRPTLQFPPGVAATARRMAVAGAVVLGSQDLATAAILRLANDGGSSGAVVLYNLAWTVFLLPWAVLAVPLATTAFPTLTSRWQAGDRAAYSAVAARTARAAVLATAAGAAVLVATAQPAARVLVLGAPGDVDPVVLSRALIAFAPGLLGYGAVAHLSRAHYARGDARTPATATAIGWLLAVVADVVLVAVLPADWTAAALGAGTSFGMTVAGVTLAATQRRGAGSGSLAGAGRSLAGCVAAALVAAAAGWAVVEALPVGGTTASVGLVAVGLAVCGLCYAAVLTVVDRPTLLLVLRRGVARG